MPYAVPFPSDRYLPPPESSIAQAGAFRPSHTGTIYKNNIDQTVNVVDRELHMVRDRLRIHAVVGLSRLSLGRTDHWSSDHE